MSWDFRARHCADETHQRRNWQYERDRENTQDMFGVSTGIFVTPDTYANAHLKKWGVKDASIFHFVNVKCP